MENNGIRPDQVVQVRGYADHNLRKPLQPLDSSNRRVTVIIQYVVKPVQPSSFVSNGTIPIVKLSAAGFTQAGTGPTPTTTKPNAGP